MHLNGIHRNQSINGKYSSKEKTDSTWHNNVSQMMNGTGSQRIRNHSAVR